METDGPAVTHRVQTAHASLIEKPVLTVADLHLIGKIVCGVDDGDLTVAEFNRLDVIEDTLADYLVSAVDVDWRCTEALVS